MDRTSGSLGEGLPGFQVAGTIVRVPPALAKKPVDELRSMAAPNELIEWVRKLPPESAARSAWVDAPRADWIPYLAVMRGITRDAILKAVCECAVEIAGQVEGPEAARAVVALRDGTTRGRDAFATIEAEMADLRASIIEQQGKSTTLPWMMWVELVLELARASSRGNPLVGISLALRSLAAARAKGRSKGAHADLVARLREKLTLAM